MTMSIDDLPAGKYTEVLPPTPSPGTAPGPDLNSQPIYRLSSPATFVTRTPSNPLEAEATRQLLLTTLTPDGYKCPRCQELFTDKDAMINHLSQEINDSLLSMQDIFAPKTATTPNTIKPTPSTTDKSIRGK